MGVKSDRRPGAMLRPMRRFLWLATWLAACGGGGGSAGPDAGSGAGRPRKVFVVSQHHAAIDVVDGTTLALTNRIPCGDRRMPHMIELAPSGDRLWVANLQLDGTAPDEVLVIDPVSETVAARIQLDVGAYVQHVAISADGATVYVSGLGSGIVYRIDARTLTRGPDLRMPAGRNPHGIKVSPDGTHLYVATSKDSVAEMDTASGQMLREWALPGPGLQLALGQGFVYATVPDPPAVARVDLGAGGIVTAWPLPAMTPSPAAPALVMTAAGPRLAVTEQGDPTTPGDQLLLYDVSTGQVAEHWTICKGSHGVTVTPDGRYEYVTGMYDDSVNVIDLQAGAMIQQANVDPMPAGLAVWSPR